MSADPLRVLIIEDVPMDAELVEYELGRARIPFEARRVDTRERFLAELDAFGPDVILSDYTLPRFDGMAARMVDAQAPGVAGTLRRLPQVTSSGSGWPGRLLAELAQLRLLVAAHQRLAELPEPLAATVRQRVGYTVAADDVLAAPPVRDLWHVLGSTESDSGNLITRRTWLWAAEADRPALVLTFGAGGREPDRSLVRGTAVPADLHFYPGQPPLRGKEAFAAAFRAASRQLRISAVSEIQEVRVEGDLAYCWNHFIVTATPLNGSPPQRRSGHALAILRRTRQGTWVLTRDANMLTLDGSVENSYPRAQ